MSEEKGAMPLHWSGLVIKLLLSDQSIWDKNKFKTNPFLHDQGAIVGSQARFGGQSLRGVWLTSAIAKPAGWDQSGQKID